MERKCTDNNTWAINSSRGHDALQSIDIYPCGAPLAPGFLMLIAAPFAAAPDPPLCRLKICLKILGPSAAVTRTRKASVNIDEARSPSPCG